MEVPKTFESWLLPEESIGIESCAVLSLIPPLLADHVIREAQQALEDLKIVEQRL